jgi:general secretion pathway protein D
MRRFNQIIAAWTLLAVLVPAPLAARTKKGEKLLEQGSEAESRKDWDQALDFYEQALSEDPHDSAYRLAVIRARFQAAQTHVDQGQRLRKQGKLEEALLEFERAYAIDPASGMADQESRRTREMIERERRKSPAEATATKPEEKGMTPAQEARRELENKIAAMQPMPELKPINPAPINLKMNNQPPRVLFETVGKLAGINVLFDPEYTPTKNQSVEFNNVSLDEALSYLELVTKSFYKPLSANAIFVTNDNTTKRRDYEEQVMKVFYLQNVNTAQELQEILTAIRSVADIQRLFTYNAQMAIVARGEADRISLAEKIINDLDKPRPEVVIDVLVMEANKAKTRDLTMAAAPGGINSPINFTPRLGIRTPGQDSSDDGEDSNDTPTTPTTPTSAVTNLIPLTNLGRISGRDFSITIPGGLLEAVMSDRSTRVLQSPQVRAVDNQKATLKIGDRVPTASGSFQPGIGGVGINPLVNTQFQYIDVGVNVDVTPKIHSGDEVSLHVEVDVSNVRDRVDIGGIDQPVIGQRKLAFDVRLREGEVNLIGGLMQRQETKTVTGVPGLSSIPVIRRLFTSEGVERSESELLIALIPHIVRSPEVTRENVRGIAVGNATTVKLNYNRTRAEGPAASPAPAAAAPPAEPVAAPVTPAPPSPAPPATAPPATAPPAAAPPATAPAPAVPPIPGVTTPPAAATPTETPTTQPPATPLAVSFAPGKVETPVNGIFRVTLVVQNATDLYAAPVMLKFDPKILRLAEVAEGNLLSLDGRPAVFTRNILNDTGDASINLSRSPGAGGISGSGTLMVLTFHAIGTGDTVVSVPAFTPRNARLEPVTALVPPLPVAVR